MDYYGKVVYVERYLGKSEVDELQLLYGRIVLPLYRHYGIGVGNGRIIHFSGDILDGGESAMIVETSESEFAIMDKIKICHRVTYKYNAAEVVSRARSQLYSDFGGYHLFDNNCEVFTTWCACGKKSSSQVFFKNDDKDIVEKYIDRAFEPVFEVAEKIDNIIDLVGNIFK